MVLPHPIGGTAVESVLAKVDAAFDEMLDKLTRAPSAATQAPATAVRAEWIEAPDQDEWDGLQAFFRRQRWTDGLPVVPPTRARVERMLRDLDRPAHQPVGLVPPLMGAATVEHVAVNALMAGCGPQHMPVLLAALDAMLDPAFNLYGLQTTTHCVAPLLMVNGPLAGSLGIHGGNNLFGPGAWSNGVVGRAIRLILLNLGGGLPGDVDKATMGHPGKYTFCMAENEAASPWPSLRADLGFAPAVSTVTVIGAEAPHNINDHESTTAGGLLTMFVGTMAQTGQNNVWYAGEPLLVICPEHAATIAAGGFGKDDVKRMIYEDARIPLKRFSRENIERRMPRKFPLRFKDRPLDTLVPIAQRWEDIMIVVAGGPGKHSMYLPTFGGTRAVTRAITDGSGKPYAPDDLPDTGPRKS